MANYMGPDGHVLRQSMRPRRPVSKSRVLQLAKWALVMVWIYGALGVIGSIIIAFKEEGDGVYESTTHPYVAIGIASLLGVLVTTLFLVTILEFVRWRVERE